MLAADQLAIDHETYGGMAGLGARDYWDSGLADHVLGLALRGLADRIAVSLRAPQGAPRGQA